MIGPRDIDVTGGLFFSFKDLEFEDDMVDWQDISDEDLLNEVYERFGESWCSFSSGVRSRGECPSCKEDVKLTRHHLVPVAEGAGRSLEVNQRYVKICQPCHRLAHAHWGPGNKYDGPQDREVFLVALRKLFLQSEDTNGSS